MIVMIWCWLQNNHHKQIYFILQKTTPAGKTYMKRKQSTLRCRIIVCESHKVLIQRKEIKKIVMKIFSFIKNNPMS